MTVQLDPNRTVNVAVQVLPLVEDAYPVVDRAIAATPALAPNASAGASVALSGVKYEVGPMETTLEGPLDQLLEIAKAAHPVRAAALQVVTIIKIGDRAGGTTIAQKVEKYRR
jgi:uncharacterized protein YqgV (UPF0045/DUF77 family)